LDIVMSQPKPATPDSTVTPDAILQLGLAFWGSKTLLSAVELGLFTLLADGPLSVEAVTARLALHPRSVRDFLDALVALGQLERKDGLYANTAAGALFLDRRKPTYVGGILEMANARLYPFWGALTEGLRTGNPQNEAKEGRDLFDEIYRSPAILAEFLKAMSGISLGAANALHEILLGRLQELRRHRYRAGRSPRNDRAGSPAPCRHRLRLARGATAFRNLCGAARTF
jgi:hypothetical protein